MNLVDEIVVLEQEIKTLLKKGVIEPEISDRIVLDYNRLVNLISSYRVLGYLVVMTIGSYDLFHVGHARFLFKVKKQGLEKSRKVILIVGVDSDLAIRRYKGKHRPIIQAVERLEMLAVQRGVDFVTVIDDIDKEGRWYYGLLRMIMPDIFVAVEDSYPEEQRREIERFCGKLVILPRQAERTSSTIIIQKVIKADPILLSKLMSGMKGLKNTRTRRRK
jgi:cytidyltransferase-like protein